jgi:hypothetical protein
VFFPFSQLTSKTPRPFLILGFRAGALRHPAGDLLSDKYIQRDLRTWDEVVHDMKSAVREKDEPVPKLPEEKLRLSNGK